MIRVFVADDHALIRSGIRQILATVADMELVGEAAHGDELLEALAQAQAEVLLLDLSMPGISGPLLIQTLIARYPGIRILVVSMHKEGPMASLSLKAGAIGYVTKDSEPEILLVAIRKVCAGGRYVDPALAEKIVFEREAFPVEPLEVMSPRELEVLRLIAKGFSLAEISGRIGVSPKTVSTYKMRLMQKLRIESNTDLLRHAIRIGLVQN
ncbi:MAG: response regulator transcription factor [Rhodocyclaceae bacterium]|nr:MAG: response regulator transcription factor [Rhodocyclaceae bacterium]